MSVLDKYSCEGQMSLFDPDTWCGKMFQVPSVPTKEKISEPSLRKPQKWQKGMPAFLDLRVESGPAQERSWVMGGQLLGEYTMHSFGECPSVENVSLLSQILEEKPHPKYSLSAKACQGILRRAEKRGKELPAILREALIRQATPLKLGGGVEVDSHGKKAGKGPLVQTELSGTLGVSQDQTLITLDLNGGTPACNQGGMAVVQGFDGYNQAVTGDVAMPLRSKSADSDHVPVVIENHPADSRVQIKEDGVVQTLSGRMGTGENNVPMVMEQGSSWDGSQVSPTLTANNAGGNQRMPDKDNFNAGLSVAQSLEVYHCVAENEKTQTLKARDYKDPHCVAYGLDRASFNQGQNAQYDFAVEEEKIGTQVAKGPGAVYQSIVRRLTPMECERLQGYPDHWTDIGEWIDSKGKKHKDADSPRYKALGNSIALPFWQWMAVRMRSYLHYPCTMASLFDGIGGFPLVFSRCGVKPVWASEIEEFPIAVTKKRFPDM